MSEVQYSYMHNTQKWAIVTGASSGIGLEFARIFAKNNTNLVLVARNVNALNSLAKELVKQYRVKVIVKPLDLSSISNSESLVKDLDKRKIIPTYLINNAGFGDFGTFTQTSWDKELKMITVNIIALTYLTKFYATKLLGGPRAYIVNVASGAAFQPGPLMAVYFATKAYVLHLSEAISEELSGTNVTVTTLCPGPTQSNFWSVAGKDKTFGIMGKMPTSKQVAEYGYQAMLNSKRVAVYGWTNRLGTLLVRLLPRSWVTKAILYAQST